MFRNSVVILVVFACSLAFGQLTSTTKPTSSPDNVYTADSGSNDVTHIVSKGMGSGTVALTCSPQDVQLPAHGYVSCPNANSIGVFDPVTNAPLPGISGVPSPAKMASCMNGAKLAVANFVMSGTQVTIFNTSDNSVSDTIDYSIPSRNQTYSVSCFGSFLAAGTNTGQVELYDISTVPATFIAEQAAGAGQTIRHVAFTPGGTALYAGFASLVSATDENGNAVQGNILVLRVSTLAIKAALTVGGGSFEPAYIAPAAGAPAGSLVDAMYVSVTDGTVVAFNAATDLAVNTFNLGSSALPRGIGVTAKAVYIANTVANNVVSLVRSNKGPQGDRFGKTFPTGNSPNGVAAR